MKKILLSMMFSLLIAISSFAQTSGYCGGEGDGTNLTWSISTSDRVLTISGTGKMADYDYWINTTSPWAIYNQSLEGVVIGDGVTSIGNSAFFGCSGLTSVTIGNSVTSIGYSAFSGCSGLTSITIPDAVAFIGHNAFSRCSSLTDIVIGSGVTSIGDYAFFGCSSLTSITIPDGVTSIGGGAFSGCSGLDRKSTRLNSSH